MKKMLSSIWPFNSILYGKKKVSYLRYTIYCTSFCTFVLAFDRQQSNDEWTNRFKWGGGKKKRVITSMWYDHRIVRRFDGNEIYAHRGCLFHAARLRRERIVIVAATNQTKQSRRNIRGRNDKETKKKKIGDIRRVGRESERKRDHPPRSFVLFMSAMTYSRVVKLTVTFIYLAIVHTSIDFVFLCF